MTTAWSPEQLRQIGGSDELHIAVRRADGSLRRKVPIWVVCVRDDVYVRTWYRRVDGWFGHVLESRRARVRVPGVEADVDDAYRAKYGRYGDATVERMVADAAAATTLWLQPE